MLKKNPARPGGIFLSEVIAFYKFLEEPDSFRKGGKGYVFVDRVAGGVLFVAHSYRAEAQGVFGKGMEMAAVGSAHDYIGRNAHIRELFFDAVGEVCVFLRMDVGNGRSIPSLDDLDFKVIFIRVFSEHRKGFLTVLVNARSDIRNKIGFLRNNVRRIGALHHCEAAGGGKNCFAEGRNHRHKRNEKRPEKPDIAQEHPHSEAEGGRHGIEHLINFRNKRFSEGALFFDFVRKGKKSCRRGVPRRS